ncbi:MAG: hypothetical protein NTZ05_18130, partial [Chloroflexi bacterium]|nr:hypothetical protein [Chloroflexota bacterium]
MTHLTGDSGALPAERARPPQSSSLAPAPRLSPAGGAALVMALSLALKAAGAVQQAAVAAVVGAGPEADAYAAAMAPPNLLIALLVFGPLSLALTTAVPSSPERSGDDGLRLASAALSWTLVGGAFLAVAGVGASPLLIALLAPGLAPDSAAHAAMLLRIMAPAVGCAAVAAALRGLLHGWGLFAVPLLAYLFAALLLLAATVLLAPVWGIDAAPWAALAGAFAGLAGQWAIVRRRAPGLRPLAVWRHAKLKDMAGMLVLTTLALAAGPAMALAARFAASDLGPGALAQLEY